jgi:tripartite-type tricarboxylate transporter receptor subunit TctC
MLNTFFLKFAKHYKTLLLALLTFSAVGQHGLTLAQDYPTRPVKIVVPFAAGGPADNYARFMGQQLQAELGQNFIVENKPGAGSIIGTDFVAKAAPDGYTLLLMSNAQTVNESLVTTKPYALLKDFVGIAPINYSDLLLVVHPRVAAKNLQELIALAKRQPGKLNYASSGNGTPYHMAGELFKAMAGIDITHVPYKGSSGARTDLLGGQVDLMFDAVTTMTDYARAGTVRGLATTGTVRSEILPDMPTMSEAGVSGYETTIWLGLMAPKGTPVSVINRLNSTITAIVTRPEIKKQWAEKGAMPLTMSPLEFQLYLERDVVKWAKIVKLSGAKAD